MHIDWPRSQQQGFCFPTVRALAKDGAAEDADLRSKSLSALVADCAPSGASTETAGFSRWSVHCFLPTRLVLVHYPQHKYSNLEVGAYGHSHLDTTQNTSPFLPAR